MRQFFSFLKEFKLDKNIIEEKGMKQVSKFKHNFFSLSAFDTKDAYETFSPFPNELKQFYEEIGFGLFHINKGKVHRIFDPASLIIINQRKDEFQYDKLLSASLKEGQLVFFESQQYGYFSIGTDNSSDVNPIFFRGKKVADSLYKFLLYFNTNRDYLKHCIND
ncbi:MAG: hypothetical protein ACK5KT_09180 [Dysgonomonas sp.]